MMNCWKTINFTKQYRPERLFILSSLTMLLTFIIVYVPATYLFVPNYFYDNYFVWFVAGMWILYPLHKILHFIPLIPCGKKVKKTAEIRFGIMPILHFIVTEPITRFTFLIALCTPFIVINTLLAAGCFLFPHYVHYFVILIAYHTGICFFDMIIMKDVMKAPAQSFIEENEDGFEILLQREG
ncbi:DUF3267 domain-containing protein [Bacillus mesophilum]|uniref:DUF3267 domain-containing protein n=1 Tax=Bacillus mesophilum TaxID=1071718 RepID=A0A7V7RJJ6_9BACI|nr:DUF3267 domain-containing protein [Bacillus mesophilum]KAB2330966.1 DUF3267 domain-containing protein [Bacillus mesophilum]